MTGGIEAARRAFDRQEWADAYRALTEAEDQTLEAADLERLAAAAYLIGRDAESASLWARAHEQRLADGAVVEATRPAFWLAFCLLNKGELAEGSGWTDRARRRLAEIDVDCVERGYMHYTAALRRIFEGDLDGALAGFRHAVAVGVRFGDPELTALARIGEGRCLIYLGEVAEGVALLDEAMVAVGAGDVSAIATGDSYCSAIDACHELYDLHRIHTWTTALSHWCDSQPDLVLYRGQCLLHRAEIMLLHGAVDDAVEEADRACARLADPPSPMVLGAACDLRAELARLRGDVAGAEQGYREANELGFDPQPGLALLRMREGRIDVALSAIRRMLDEATDPAAGARLLGAAVEVLIAAGEVDGARAAAHGLDTVAATLRSPYLAAQADHAAGAVLVEAGDAAGALVVLRRAWKRWRELEVPYEAARTRVLLGRARRAMGDDDGADMELDAARAAFVALGAGPDVARVDGLLGAVPDVVPGGLTAREVEVLRLVAAGLTNRAIADELVISEKTAASHVSHIFTKLDLRSRAAATAWAYEHQLV